MIPCGSLSVDWGWGVFLLFVLNKLMTALTKLKVTPVHQESWLLEPAVSLAVASELLASVR